MSLDFNYTSQPRELVSQALDWFAQGRQICLATLINIDGNAPYPVGTQMLIDHEANFFGQITGGCAEQAIAEQAKQLIKNGQSTVQRYGTGSPYFDIKLPCGSGIDIHFQAAPELDELTSIKQQLDQRQAVKQQVDTSFSKRYLPNPQLIIAGQGLVCLELANLAKLSGYDVACIAQNDSTQALLAEHNLISCQMSDSITQSLSECDLYTAFVSLFHDHDLEIPLLEQVLKSQSFYIGALGSKRTHRQRVESLHQISANKSEIQRIHGPVGLDVGAKTPSQIAISILAELIQVQNKNESAN